MKFKFLPLLFACSLVFADTPPPNKARLYDGSGATPITATGSSINVNATNASLPLPTGAATSANQTSGNSSLTSIATNTANIPALGQALAAGSVPVVLTASQLTTLTPPTLISAAQSGSWTTGRTWTLSNSTDSVAAVQSGTWNLGNITGTITLPTNAATSGNQATEISDLASIVTNTSNIPALGQALAAGSVPVVLPAAQITTLTPPTSTGRTWTLSNSTDSIAANQAGNWSVRAQDGSGNALTSAALSGSKQALDVAVRNSSGTQVDPTQIRTLTSSDQVTVANSSLTVAQATGTNLHTVVDSGSTGVTNLPTTVDTNNGTAGASTLRAALADDVVVTGPSAQTSGNNLIIAGGAASSCASYRSVSIQINSTATGGTIIFEGSNDNSNFVSIPVDDLTTAGATAPIVSYTPAASTRVWGLPCNMQFVRARVSSGLTGGSVQAIARFSTMPFHPLSNVVQQNTAASLAVNAAQSTAASTANGWPVKPTDGTTVITVKAASTAAVAGDTSMVVEQAPNGGNPCQNPSATLQRVNGATSGTAATQIIALSGSTKIYICSLNVIGVSGTTPTFSLVEGTGSNCAASQSAILHSFTTSAGVLYNFQYGATFADSGDAICYLDTGSSPVQDFDITYVQQ